jgi:hypothetical protein
MSASIYGTIQFDLQCDYDGDPPAYRVYVGNKQNQKELFTERNYIWKEPQFLTEILQLNLPAGEYYVLIESLDENANFRCGDIQSIKGPIKELGGNSFEVCYAG